jgi:hypothetical protein
MIQKKKNTSSFALFKHPFEFLQKNKKSNVCDMRYTPLRLLKIN